MTDAIEVRPGWVPPTDLRHAVFDWDGTLSFIRAGGGEVMPAAYLDHLPALPGDTVANPRQLAPSDLWGLNGKPNTPQ